MYATVFIIFSKHKQSCYYVQNACLEATGQTKKKHFQKPVGIQNNIRGGDDDDDGDDNDDDEDDADDKDNHNDDDDNDDDDEDDADDNHNDDDDNDDDGDNDDERSTLEDLSRDQQMVHTRGFMTALKI